MRVSHEAFPQGCPTCHSGVSQYSALKSTQCRENWFPWNGLRHLGDSGNGGRTLEFLSPFLWRAPPLEMRPNSGNCFPTTQGKDPSSRARRQKRGSSRCGRDSRASSRVETGISGDFLSCSKGVKDPLEVPDIRTDYARDASAEMGLISPGGENLLYFLELRQVLSTYDGDLRDPR